MGVSEKVLWEHLRAKRLGFKFRRQFPIGPYVLDFYCAEAKLCVEVDGEQHESKGPDDRVRDVHLEALGIQTLRIRSTHLFEPIDVLARIQEACKVRVARNET